MTEYTKHNFVDNNEPSISAENLNEIEEGIRLNSIHTHGNITNDGKVGAAADKILFTGVAGAVEARSMSEAGIQPTIVADVDYVVPPTVVNVEAGTITLALDNNREYYFANPVSTLTITFPAGLTKYHCWIRFTTASSTPTITLPASAKYLGVSPIFGASKVYEIDIKDGIVIVAEEA